jgi:hypothetical protein
MGVDRVCTISDDHEEKPTGKTAELFYRFLDLKTTFDSLRELFKMMTWRFRKMV